MPTSLSLFRRSDNRKAFSPTHRLNLYGGVRGGVIYNLYQRPERSATVICLRSVSYFIRAERDKFTPSIIINTIKEPINPFEEKFWGWIKIGNDVILRSVKSVPSHDENCPHLGIYYGLWKGGNVKLDDEVFVYCSEHRVRKSS